MLLSIAMIVKNEEEYIERCLIKLKEIQKKIKCEIVIVDTGSSDKTINICKQYTEKLYCHEWNGSFADMRNISLDYCCGDWVLILDADEIIESSDGIVKFFVSKEYKKYKSASIKMYNITNLKNEQFIIAKPIRLYERSKELRYSGRVHEQLPYMLPIGSTDMVIKHYGYQSDDIKKMIHKYERNKELLLINHNENPNNIYNLFQLYQTFAMANYKEEAHRYIDKAYKLAIKNSEINKRLYVKQSYINSLFNNQRYDECLNEILDYKLNLKSNIAIDIDYYFMGGMSAFVKEKYHVAIEYLNAYLELYKKIERNACEWDLTCSVFTYNQIDKVKVFLVESNYKLKRYDGVINIYNKEFKDEVKSKMQKTCALSFIKQKKYNEAKDILRDIEISRNLINEICIELGRGFDNESIVVGELLGVNKEIDIYIKTCVLNCNDKFEFEIKDFNDKFYWYKAEVLKKLIVNNRIDIDQLINLSKDKMLYINYLMEDFIVKDKVITYINENYLTTDLKKVKFIKSLSVEVMQRELDDLDVIMIVKIMNLNNIYVKSVYNQEIFNSELYTEILNSEEVFWVKLYNIKKLNNSTIIYMKSLKILLDDYPEYNKIIETLLKNISDINKVIISDEMNFEKDNILKVTEGFINSLQLEEANKIILELKQTFKADKEILIQLGLINYFKGMYDEALNIFMNGLFYDLDNYEIYFNIATVLEEQGKIIDSIYYYKLAYENCTIPDIKKIIIEKCGL